VSKRIIKLGFAGLGFIGSIHAIACFSMPLIFKNLPFEIKLGKVYRNNLIDIPHFFEKGAKSLEEILEDSDAVDICTPNYLHYEQAIKTIERGIPLYLEKPIGINSEEAYDIMENARKKGLIHQTALMYRFMPAVTQARDMIKNGEIGEILNFKALMLHSGYMDPKRPISWKLKKSTSGGGAILDPENRARLWADNKVVWLKIPLDTVWQRTAGDDSRPLLKGSTREQVEALFKQREPYYALAHLHVEVEGKSPGQIAREILEGLKVWLESCR